MTTTTGIPIRITTRVKCPCGASYAYLDATGPDPVIYAEWVAVHSAHWRQR